MGAQCLSEFDGVTSDRLARVWLTKKKG